MKTSLILSEEAWERLQFHAIVARKKPSALVESWIMADLRTVRVQHIRPGGEAEARSAVGVA